MYRKICFALKNDRVERVRKADEAVRTKLINGEVKEAVLSAADTAPWNRMEVSPVLTGWSSRRRNGWHCMITCPPTVKKIPCNVKRNPVVDGKDMYIRAAMMWCRSGRAGGVSRIRAEDVKGRLRDMEQEEAEEEGYNNAGDMWRLVVRLMQHI